MAIIINRHSEEGRALVKAMREGQVADGIIGANREIVDVNESTMDSFDMDCSLAEFAGRGVITGRGVLLPDGRMLRPMVEPLE